MDRCFRGITDGVEKPLKVLSQIKNRSVLKPGSDEKKKIGKHGRNLVHLDAAFGCIFPCAHWAQRSYIYEGLEAFDLLMRSKKSPGGHIGCHGISGYEDFPSKWGLDT